MNSFDLARTLGVTENQLMQAIEDINSNNKMWLMFQQPAGYSETALYKNPDKIAEIDSFLSNGGYTAESEILNTERKLAKEKEEERHRLEIEHLQLQIDVLKKHSQESKTTRRMSRTAIGISLIPIAYEILKSLNVIPHS